MFEANPTTTQSRPFRLFCAVVAVSVIAYLAHCIVVFWFDWPGLVDTLFTVLQLGPANDAPDPVHTLGLVQIVATVALVVGAIAWVWATPNRGFVADANAYSRAAAFIIRVAFWAVFLVGLADAVISFLRVEGILSNYVGEELNKALGRARFRGAYVHFPLILVSVVIAACTRTLGFIWLGFLVVLAEFQIVIWRFVFSYEQTFMGDLVRFWYAALFLFASAYALAHDGHVRVDVFYARFSERKKALVNIIGSAFLGLPLCWTILIDGMWSKQSSLAGPLLAFEISQSGYGMYVKYLMAAFLIVFAVSMIFQFCSYILSNAAIVLTRQDAEDTPTMQSGPDAAASI